MTRLPRRESSEISSVRPGRSRRGGLAAIALAAAFAVPCAWHAPASLAAPADAAAPADSGAAAAAPADPSAGLSPAASTAGAAMPAQQAVDPKLRDDVDTFWHYAKVADYALATQAGQKVLADNADPGALLSAFESVAKSRNDVLDDWLLRWQRVPQMKAVTGQLIDKINSGFNTRRADRDYIRNTILAMASGERGYQNNLPRLADSDQLAVAVMLDMLATPSDAKYASTVRRALRDLGRRALNPLLAATRAKNTNLLIDIVAALGDIGYPASVPYLASLAQGNGDPAVKSAAAKALGQMGAGNAGSLRPADLFYALAEKFYYGQADFGASGAPVSYYWNWTDDKGLVKTDVPSPIFNDLMAMRCAEQSLSADASKGTAVSLWLDANNKREADLPEGATDPLHAGKPDAHYYNVSVGVQYLNDALARALKDRNAAVALKLTHGLRDIIGSSNSAFGNDDPIVQALYFPSRLVRYEAAFALAGSLPTKPFQGSDRVVPLLVEALSQTTKPNVLVIAPAGNDDLNAIQGAVGTLGYNVAGGSDALSASNQAGKLPAVDVVVVGPEVSGADFDRLRVLRGQTPKLQGASVLVLSSPASMAGYQNAATTDPFLTVVPAPASKDGYGEALKAAIDQARAKAGGSMLSEDQAASYAMTAAQLLSRLAISRGTVFDTAVALPGVLAAVNDARPPIVMAVGEVLAFTNAAPAQDALLARASAADAPGDLRVSLFKDLATNAKFYGNRLDATAVDNLARIATTEKDANVRDAAAQARGALNLPADQSKELILSQAKM